MRRHPSEPITPRRPAPQCELPLLGTCGCEAHGCGNQATAVQDRRLSSLPPAGETSSYDVQPPQYSPLLPAERCLAIWLGRRQVCEETRLPEQFRRNQSAEFAILQRDACPPMARADSGFRSVRFGPRLVESADPRPPLWLANTPPEQRDSFLRTALPPAPLVVPSSPRARSACNLQEQQTDY